MWTSALSQCAFDTVAPPFALEELRPPSLTSLNRPKKLHPDLSLDAPGSVSVVHVGKLFGVGDDGDEVTCIPETKAAACLVSSQISRILAFKNVALSSIRARFHSQSQSPVNHSHQVEVGGCTSFECDEVIQKWRRRCSTPLESTAK
jgi:hypothetical protein